MAVRKKETTKGTAYIIDVYDLNGNRIRKTVYTSRKRAEEIAKAIEGKKAEAKLGFGDVQTKPNLPFSEAVKYYLRFAKNQKKKTTLEREQGVYSKFQQYIDNATIGSIRFRDVSAYMTKIYEEDGLSAHTVDIEIRMLKQFFNFLIRHELIKKNPVKGLKGFRKEQDGIRFLTVEEIHQLFEVMDDQNYKDAYLMYLHTGARKSEILPDHFTWGNVDFKRRMIRLEGKGSKSREVPMNDTVYEILKRR